MALKTQPRVYFFYDGIKVSIRNRNALKSFVAYVFKAERVKLQAASYIFTTDKVLLKINNEYLNHNYLTDIITFPLSEPGHPLLADIYISVDRVLDNSKKFSVNHIEELYRVIFHGTLHLCGYSDKTKTQKKRNEVKREFLFI